MRLLEGHSDEQLFAMIECLEQGRELVEQELKRMEGRG